MISKTTLCMLLCCLLFCAPVEAQQGKRSITVTGVVLDGSQAPVAGAAVVLKGTSVGTTTGVDGKFRLSVPEKGTLVVSFLGFTTREIELTSSTDYRITMEESDKTLDEVVVIGYGTMRKRDLTGSVAQIRPDNIAIENPQSVQDILRSTPGLNVGYDASAKGGGSLQIRGQRSVYTSNNHSSPLLVLDGMVFNGELSEINPDDISQIDILKDASSAAVYGAKAANGVILITTKKGKKGKPVVSVTTNFGWSQQVSNRERFSPSAYMQHRQDWLTTSTYGINPATGEYDAYQKSYSAQPGYYANPNRLPSDVSIDDWRGYSVNDPDESNLSIWARRLGLKGNALENFLAGNAVDWEKKAFRTGFNQDYSASVSGAGNKANYYFSLGYLKNQGVCRNDDYTAVRANLKVDFEVNKWFQIGANVNFQDRSDGNLDMSLGSLLENSPYADYANEYGNPVQYPLDTNYSRRGYNWDFEKHYQKLERGYTVLNSIFNAKIKLPFNITYTFNAAPRFQFYYDREFLSAELPDSSPEKRGANRESRKNFNWSLNNTINWDYTFANKHHIALTLVQEAEEIQSWRDRIEARKILPSDALGFHNTQNGTKENSSFSTSDARETADALLARLFYSYDDRYMITASVRRDGYSAFGSSNPYATFPSVAAAWTFTNEEFLKNWQKVLNYGKLRVSYGKNGNRSLSSPYLALANLSAGGGKMHGYLTAGGDQELYRYLMVDRMANPDLQWEKTTSWNFGLDFGFLNNRISGSIDYYRMQTHDMIMGQRLPEFTGFSSITTNLGQVDNNGIEISLQSVNIEHKNFRWTTSVGFSYNKNKITHLYYNYVNGVEQDDVSNEWFIGQPINAIWNYRVTGIWQKDEAEEAARYGQSPGDPKVANLYTADDIVNPDGSVTPVYNDKDKEILGETTPPIRWSMRNEFILWKNLTFSFNIYSYMGHKSLSTNYLNDDDSGARLANGLANLPSKKYWTVDNPTNEYARIDAVGPTGATSPGKIYSRSFIRLENISLSYQLPRKWTSKFDLQSVKVFGSIRNAATWAKEWEYGDPETGTWAARMFTLGINLTF